MPRIIAGYAKGQQLLSPKNDLTRPTTDRVREAAFAMIVAKVGQMGEAAQQLAGLSFLDLYAGTGAVGLEAASRGAAPVWAVEKDSSNTALIRQNSRRLGLATQTRHSRVELFAAKPAPLAFNIVWADPPYETDSSELEDIVRLLVDNGWLKANALVIVERSIRSAVPNWRSDLHEIDRRNYGETSLYFAMKG
ncbi:MAG: 16S rRNA (guanine(966)-N(2))-methyltransferase RsmD [Propionibacteriaceae bacterium]|nr:16S rRNA (guanine(966)-N(2))-methyltransferase RsmD [Propionibacteriaceae bacterium]